MSSSDSGFSTAQFLMLMMPSHFSDITTTAMFSTAAQPHSGNRDGSQPASKASIESMPLVKITEKETECSICLNDYEINGNAKEMPCKHKFHPDCINKWLSCKGSCPVCRYQLPVENNNINDYSDQDSMIHEFLNNEFASFIGEFVGEF